MGRSVRIVRLKQRTISVGRRSSFRRAPRTIHEPLTPEPRKVETIGSAMVTYYSYHPAGRLDHNIVYRSDVSDRVETGDDYDFKRQSC
jgi:hypothetical protein